LGLPHCGGIEKREGGRGGGLAFEGFFLVHSGWEAHCEGKGWCCGMGREQSHFRDRRNGGAGACVI